MKYLILIFFLIFNLNLFSQSKEDSLVIHYINEYRALFNLSKLTYSDSLKKISNCHVKWTKDNNEFKHAKVHNVYEILDTYNTLDDIYMWTYARNKYLNEKKYIKNVYKDNQVTDYENINNWEEFVEFSKKLGFNPKMSLENEDEALEHFIVHSIMGLSNSKSHNEIMKMKNIKSISSGIIYNFKFEKSFSKNVVKGHWHMIINFK